MRSYLVEQGLPDSSVTSKGFGEEYASFLTTLPRQGANRIAESKSSSPGKSSG